MDERIDTFLHGLLNMRGENATRSSKARVGFLLSAKGSFASARLLSERKMRQHGRVGH
jgi:hypothetical protein